MFPILPFAPTGFCSTKVYEGKTSIGSMALMRIGYRKQKLPPLLAAKLSLL
jgi:hypothetical protein